MGRLAQDRGKAGRASAAPSLALRAARGLAGVFLLVYGAALAISTSQYRSLYDQLDAPSLDLKSFQRDADDQTAFWRNIVGLRTPRLDLLIAIAEKRSDPEALPASVQALGELLAVEPTSSISWAKLARARALSGQSMDAVEQSLFMSIATGRYEGYAMYERSLLSLPLWPYLSAPLRRHMRNEIADLVPFLDRAQFERFREVLSSMPQATQQEIRGLPLTGGRRL